jgi:hypothetical protein
MRKYILDGKNPVAVDDALEWAKWFETADRTVKKSKIGDAEISTVFLGLDHNWGLGPPVLFETMIFGGRFDEDQDRYCTWDEAIKGHDCAVEKVKEKYSKYIPNKRG